MSYGNFSFSDVVGAGFRRLVRRFRSDFAERFAGFLNEGFSCHEEMALAFGVNVSTARKWAAADHQPTGFAVAIAFSIRPALAAKWLLLGGWLTAIPQEA